MKQALSLRRSQWATKGSSGATSSVSAAAARGKSIVSTAKSQSDVGRARPSARDPTSRTDRISG